MYKIFEYGLSIPSLILLLLSGIYFTYKLKFVQFTNLKKMIKLTFKTDHESSEVSAFQAFTIALAARVGVGSLAGIALALTKGGVGAIFWMWIFALIGASNAFAESTLSQKYQEQDEEGNYIGGPSYYTKNGLGRYKLGAIYALIIIISYSFGYTAIQMNQISSSLYDSFSIDKFHMGIFVAVLIGLIIFGGLKSIAKVTEIVVPFMAGLFMISSLAIVVTNITGVFDVFLHIVKNAFNIRSIGIAAFLNILVIGYKRGVFSNEAGLGSGGIASASTVSAHSCDQGLVQVFGVYVTTLIICTLTAIVIILSGLNLDGSSGSGIVLTQNAFGVFYENFGEAFIAIALFFFATSTILSGYYYGESSLDYMSQRNIYKFILRLIVIATILVSSIASSDVIWMFVDILIALMALYNVIIMFMLRKDVIEEYESYK